MQYNFKNYYSLAQEIALTKILVLYYSSYGHIEGMAEEVAQGVTEVEGVDVVVKRVLETMPKEIAKRLFAGQAK